MALKSESIISGARSMYPYACRFLNLTQASELTSLVEVLTRQGIDLVQSDQEVRAKTNSSYLSILKARNEFVVSCGEGDPLNLTKEVYFSKDEFKKVPSDDLAKLLQVYIALSKALVVPVGADSINQAQINLSKQCLDYAIFVNSILIEKLERQSMS